jgi:hypothetical protein
MSGMKINGAVIGYCGAFNIGRVTGEGARNVIAIIEVAKISAKRGRLVPVPYE